tara:strand:- start:14828 stop:16918 length:2091 start_codon:yes stop_codon:yes gene_type:complete
MSKVSLLFLSVFMSLFCLKGQNYVQLNDSVECGASNHISIYGTYEDVKVLEGFLKNCSDLEYIRIKGFSSGEHWNHLFSLLSRHSSLKGLELFYNDGLEKVPKKIKENNSLRTISIIGNKDLNYEDLFKKLMKHDNLQKISLVDNKLKEVPGALKNLKGLKKLHISGNESLNYEHLIDNLKESNIEELSIPLNSLSDIPENIKYLKKLKVLDIRKNYISELPDEISLLDSLNEFMSEDNIFLDVNEELSKLKELNIRYLSFDPVKENEFEKIRSIFPKATIERNESEFPLLDDGTSLIWDKGESFDKSKLSGNENCDKAIKQYYALFSKRNEYFNYDSLGFFERLSNSLYSYNEKVLADGRYEGVRLMSHNKLFNRRDVNYPKHKTKKGEIAFSICPDGNLYPELKAFNSMLWIYVGEKSRRDFLKQYINNKSWKDVYLEYDKSNETFFVVIKGDFLEKIPAYPRYVNPQSSLKNAKLQYDKKFKMYERRLMLRSLRFNKEIEREKVKNKLRKKKRENQNWSRLKSYMCTYEKTLNKDGWLNYKNYFISSNHTQLDTVSVSPVSLKLSSKVKYISFREGSVTGGKNFLNSVLGKVSLSIAQASGSRLPTKCFVYYPEINEIYWFNGDFDGFIEFKNNLNFIVAFLKEDLISFSVKEDFVKEIRSVFQEKSPLDYSIIKPFKKYSLQEFWNMMESLK